jgi:hypothetical protein
MTTPSYTFCDACKWVPEELRAFTKPKEEDKPYVPPAYYGEDEEEQLFDSSEDENQEESSSELNEMSLHQDNSECVAEMQEKSSKVEEVDHRIASSSKQSTTNETDVRDRRKGKM